MHLQTVHASSYYSASPSTTNTTSTGPCLNVTMTSRVMHGIQKCISAVNTSNSSSAFNASTASPAHFTLHARNIDDKESQGKHTTTIVIIIVLVLVFLIICGLTVAYGRLNDKSVQKSINKGHGYARKHNADGSKGPAVPLQNYRSGAGLSAPPRSHGGRARAPQFPGPRNGFAASGHSNRNSRGPSPYVGGPTMGGRSVYY